MLLSKTPPQGTNFTCIGSPQRDEQELIERIQSGEAARDEVILHLQPALQRMAYRMYQRHFFYSQEERAIEPTDLVQEASARMLEKFPRAREQEKPLAWLCIVACNAMRDCLNGRSDAIKHEPGRYAIPLLKLSAMVPVDQDGATAALAETIPYEVRLPAPSTAPDNALEDIQQAVATLPGKQRIAIERHFGLNGNSPVSLRQISREFSPNIARACSAEHHYRRALQALRQTLSQVFPQYTTVGGAK